MNIQEKLASMTLEQKLGHVIVCRGVSVDNDQETKEFMFDKLRRGCVGALQGPTDERNADYIWEILEAAPNPMLMCADMETGFPRAKRKLPQIMGLAATDSEELAYDFGLITAIEAKAAGFNMVWSPVVDLLQGDAQNKVERTMGTDPQRVTRLARQMIRGYTDGGMVYTAKHFPGGSDVVCDSHLFSTFSSLTEEQLMEYDLIPYLELIRSDHLAGIMVGHDKYPAIDPVYPASLSETIISIIRRAGFEGVMITDSFAMMSVINEFGEEGCVGRAIQAGNDLLLPNYRISYKQSWGYLENAYRQGVITPERLDEAVARVLRAQEIASRPAPQTELTEKQLASLNRLSSDSICAVSDGALALDRDKKHLFIVLKENLYQREAGGEVAEIGAVRSWHPDEIGAQLKRDFPNSTVTEMCEFPCGGEIHDTSYLCAHSDDVVFVTFCKGLSYTATDGLTDRMIQIMTAFQDKLAAIVHIGNPYAMEKVPHCPRIIFGFSCGECEKYALEVLAGKREALGSLPVDLKLQ